MQRTQPWRRSKVRFVRLVSVNLAIVLLLISGGCVPISTSISTPTAVPATGAEFDDTITDTNTLPDTATISPTLAITAGEGVVVLGSKEGTEVLSNADTPINQAYWQWIESTGITLAEITPALRAASPSITVTLLLEDEAAVDSLKSALTTLNGNVLAEAGTTLSIQLPIGEVAQLSSLPGVLLIQTPSIAPPISYGPTQTKGFRAPDVHGASFSAPTELPEFFASRSWSQAEINAWANSVPIDFAGLQEILAQKQGFFPLADTGVNLAYQNWQATVVAAGGDVAVAAATSELITVTLVMQDLAAATAAEEWLPTRGATLVDAYREWLVISTPVGQVKALMELPGLLLAQQPAMKPPAEPFPTAPEADAQNMRPNEGAQGPVVTEGVAKSGIEQWHSAGYTGEGVKIAIVDNYDQAIIDEAYSQGELPTNVLNGPSVQGVNHGIAVAEIVYDMAPDATISLHSIGNTPDYCVTFANTLEGFAKAGNHIISSSTGPAFCTTAGDGSTSPLTAAVERVFDEYDTFYAQAAGNNSQHHYEGTFDGISVDVGDATLDIHSYDDETTVNILSLTDQEGNFVPFPLAANSTAFFYLRWDGGWPRSSQDYDMFLVYLTEEGWIFLTPNDCPQFACYSAITQAGAAPPIERIETLVPYDGFYGVVIVKYDADRDHFLDLLTSHAQPYLANHVKTRSLVAAASYPAVFAVAAVDVTSLNLESYSSQGPTYGPGNAPNGGFDQPQLAGFAKVSTSVAPEFDGTSAATPHVAGAAAVLRGAASCLTAREAGEWLKEQATDRGPGGYDHQFGAGVLTFPAPSARPPCNQGPFPPQAVGDGYTTITNTLVSGNLLDNDSDPQASPLAVTDFSQPADGTATVAANGAFTYSPDKGFAGMDFFTYTIQNSHNLTSTAAVYVLVQAEDEEPATVIVHTPGVPTTQAISGQPYGLSLQLPGALLTGLDVDEFLAIVYTPILSPTVDLEVADGSFASIIFSLDGYINGVPRKNVNFTTPLNLNLQYRASTVQGIDPDSLGMLYWDEGSDSWESDGVRVVVRALPNRRVTVTTTHLTQFGLFSLLNPSEISALMIPILFR